MDHRNGTYWTVKFEFSVIYCLRVILLYTYIILFRKRENRRDSEELYTEILPFFKTHNKIFLRSQYLLLLIPRESNKYEEYLFNCGGNLET